MPAAAAAPAVSVTFPGVPGVRESIVGLAVTPAGRPLIATVTVPVNELIALAVTLTEPPAPPPLSASVVGDMETEKSGGGGTKTLRLAVAA